MKKSFSLIFAGTFLFVLFALAWIILRSERGLNPSPTTCEDGDFRLEIPDDFVCRKTPEEKDLWVGNKEGAEYLVEFHSPNRASRIDREGIKRIVERKSRRTRPTAPASADRPKPLYQWQTFGKNDLYVETIRKRGDKNTAIGVFIVGDVYCLMRVVWPVNAGTLGASRAASILGSVQPVATK